MSTGVGPRGGRFRFLLGGGGGGSGGEGGEVRQCGKRCFWILSEM